MINISHFFQIYMDQPEKKKKYNDNQKKIKHNKIIQYDSHKTSDRTTKLC